MATTPTMSSAEQPRDRSLTGLAMPCRMGAVGVGAGEALDQLVADVAGLEVGEHEHVGLAGNGGAGSLELGDGGDNSGIELQVAVDGELGSLLLAELHSLLDLLGDLAASGAHGGVGEHGHVRSTLPMKVDQE